MAARKRRTLEDFPEVRKQDERWNELHQKRRELVDRLQLIQEEARASHHTDTPHGRREARGLAVLEGRDPEEVKNDATAVRQELADLEEAIRIQKSRREETHKSAAREIASAALPEYRKRVQQAAEDAVRLARSTAAVRELVDELEDTCPTMPMQGMRRPPFSDAFLLSARQHDPRNPNPPRQQSPLQRWLEEIEREHGVKVKP